MKIVIDLKNTSKSSGFKKDDLIVYDGKQWYVTSVKSLYADLEKRYNDMIAKIDHRINDLNQNYADFMRNYNEQNSKLLPVLEELLGKEE